LLLISRKGEKGARAVNVTGVDENGLLDEWLEEWMNGNMPKGENTHPSAGVLSNVDKC